jgi:acylphosphatase
LITHLVRITGLVQGVGYRAWTEREATARGLAGWVRNRRDGSVEALFAGAAAEVEAMIEACWQGPRGAVVRDVRHEVAAPVPGAGFRLLPTE